MGEWFYTLPASKAILRATPGDVDNGKRTDREPENRKPVVALYDMPIVG